MLAVFSLCKFDTEIASKKIINIVFLFTLLTIKMFFEKNLLNYKKKSLKKLPCSFFLLYLKRNQRPARADNLAHDTSRLDFCRRTINKNNNTKLNRKKNL